MSALLEQKLFELTTVGIAQEICTRIADYIKEAPGPRLIRMSPYRLADEWSLDRNAVLDAFLYGTRVGIFDLHWSIKCPSCKGPTLSTESLLELVPRSHCSYCKIDIEGGLDDAVEITFLVNANIKDVGTTSPLEVSQAWGRPEEPMTFSAEPQGQQVVNMYLKPGTYHLFGPSFHPSSPLLVKDGSIESARMIEYIYDGTELKRGNEWYEAGNFSLTLLNNSDEDVEFTFARASEFPWVSGANVSSNQIFRDYFSSELISPDETFSIQNIVFVFTDIKGSTDLYERRGDSKAYYLVREHFKIMTEIVKKNNGAIVKTIGDAVMAIFMVSTDAVNAVCEMHKAFETFNLNEESRDDIIIKVGAHRGPCIAVTSNDKLDYFGRTVNIAARVQGLSGGNDIMLSKALYQEPLVESLVQENGWKAQAVQATLKGIEGLYDVMHLIK